MYPFERFTERAKRMLTLAQEEAERAGHAYIGTEHLLLGLLREQESLAARALNNLGVEIDGVRKAVASVLGSSERATGGPMIPTTRVKKVIEIAFEEAQRMGNNYVGTEHILVAIVLEGEGIAAHVLEDMGATVDRLRPELERLIGEGAAAGGPRSLGPLLSQDSQTLISLATAVARAWLAGSVEPQHLQHVLQDPEARTLLEQSSRMAALQRQVDRAVAQGEVDEAALLQDQLARLKIEYDQARSAWEKGLGRSGTPGPTGAG